MFVIDFKQYILSLLYKKKDLDFLYSFPIFEDFTYHELHLFSQIIQVRDFKEGEIVYQEQFPLAVLYLVAKGEISINNEYQKSESPIFINEHQLLGFIDMYNEDRRKGEAKANKELQLLAISHLDFKSFLKNNPRTGVKLLNNVCKILSKNFAGYMQQTWHNS